MKNGFRSSSSTPGFHLFSESVKQSKWPLRIASMSIRKLSRTCSGKRSQMRSGFPPAQRKPISQTDGSSVRTGIPVSTAEPHRPFPLPWLLRAVSGRGLWISDRALFIEFIIFGNGEPSAVWLRPFLLSSVDDDSRDASESCIFTTRQRTFKIVVGIAARSQD